MTSQKIAHVALVLLLILFTVGFIANGFFKLTFNLESVWYGVGIFVAGRSTKYITDSKYNSPAGEAPDGSEK